VDEGTTTRIRLPESLNDLQSYQERHQHTVPQFGHQNLDSFSTNKTSTTHLSGSATTTYWPVEHRQTSFVPPEVAKNHIGMSLSRRVHSRSRELTVGFVIRPTNDSNIPQLMSGSQTSFLIDDLRSLHAQPIKANQTAGDAQMLVKAPQALPMIRPSTKRPLIRH